MREKWKHLTWIFVAIIGVQSVFADNFPGLRGPVNDFASVISSRYEQQMQDLAVEVLQKTGASVVVATVTDLSGYTPQEYANLLFEKWGIGQKGIDKGVLLLLSIEKDARNIWIEVGYGLEGILPDGKVGRIIDDYMMDSFRQGDYGAGLLNGMAAVSQIVARDAGVSLSGSVATRQAVRQTGKKEGGGIGTLVFFIVLMIVTRGRILPWLIMGSMMGGGRSRGGFGGGFSGGGFSGGFGGGMSGGGGAGRSF